VPATGSAARPRRLHRRRHRRTDPPLHHRPRARRASPCPPCAEVYRADTYQLIHAGLTGGKGVPATVADHPCVFVTLTAPSFGPVHARREKDGRVLACRPRRKDKTCPHGIRLSCSEKHAREDDRLGEPLCPDCYDYAGAVLFNACAPELWRRFTITLRRTLDRQAGLTGQALAVQLRVSYAKVAEYQRRGAVHFHAIIRLDGPAGPADAPPAWVTITLLTTAIDQAARAVSVTTPAAPGPPARVLRWGRQLDIRPITTNGDVTDTKVAAYVAKCCPTLKMTDWHYAGRGHLLIDLLAADLMSPPPRGGPPAPADRPRSRRDPGHLPQQALRTAGQRCHLLGPHRRITPYPRHRLGGIRLQTARRKDRRLMPATTRKNTPRAPRWCHETRHHLVVRDPRQGP
jgi:hypothetical protein